MVCTEEDVEGLKKLLEACCAKIKEHGGQAVVITCSFEQLQEDGSGRGHNRVSFRNGNFFECLGLIDMLHNTYLNDN